MGKEINLSRCYPGELVPGDIIASYLGATVTVEWQGGENLIKKTLFVQRKSLPQY